MKAKQVNEFEQGKDPYDTMNLGKYDNDYDFKNPEQGDRIELLEDLYTKQAGTTGIFPGAAPMTLKELHRRLYIFKKNSICVFSDVYGDPAWDVAGQSSLPAYFPLENPELFKALRGKHHHYK
jgi:hypothetical protein